MWAENELLQTLKGKLLDAEPGVEIRLFGSRARGDESKDSDIDLLVLIPDEQWNPKKANEIEEMILFYGLSKGYFINPIIQSKIAWENSPGLYPLYLNVEHEGILI
jgi:uncharacterized protein